LTLFAAATIAAWPAWSSTLYGPTDYMLAGGWSWPVEGRFADGWDPGWTVAAGFRSQVAPNVRGGVDLSYSVFGLDTAYFSAAPPAPVDGGDAGVFSLTTETDVFLRREEGGARYTLRPFLNAGLGYYHVAIDTKNSGNIEPFDPAQYDGHAFGLHGGAGLLWSLGSVELRIDAVYRHLFVGGDDIGYVPVRLGLVFGH
jgi:opacity protein-like surface antigen